MLILLSSGQCTVPLPSISHSDFAWAPPPLCTPPSPQLYRVETNFLVQGVVRHPGEGVEGKWPQGVHGVAEDSPVHGQGEGPGPLLVTCRTLSHLAATAIAAASAAFPTLLGQLPGFDSARAPVA